MMLRRALLLVTLLPFALFATQEPTADFPVDRAENGVTWQTNFEDSVECAKGQEKPLFVLFTGSDWCGWCKKLEGEALSSSEFGAAAGDKFIFVKLDFPSRIVQSKILKEQNKVLKERFGVRGFPTVLILDGELRKIAQTGYQPGGGKKYAEHLLKLTSEHMQLKDRMAAFREHGASGVAHRELFEMARRLGEEDYQQELIAAGVEVKEPYFLLEQYQSLLKEDPVNPELGELRRALTADGSHEMAYRLAIVDYVQNSFEQRGNSDTDSVAKPLLSYLQEYGAVDGDNAWRVQLQVATLYKNEGKNEEAARYLEMALESAPESHKKEVEAVLTALK